MEANPLCSEITSTCRLFSQTCWSFISSFF